MYSRLGLGCSYLGDPVVLVMLNHKWDIARMNVNWAIAQLMTVREPSNGIIFGFRTCRPRTRASWQSLQIPITNGGAIFAGTRAQYRCPTSGPRIASCLLHLLSHPLKYTRFPISWTESTSKSSKSGPAALNCPIPKCCLFLEPTPHPRPHSPTKRTCADSNGGWCWGSW